MPDPADRTPPVVSLPFGQLQGTWCNDVRVFRGVPFAAPPIGALRFAPPEPPAPWQGMRTVACHGPIAPQTRSRLARVTGDFPAEQNEDCLHLTVWTPGDVDKPRPVFVWIHGGAFVTGAHSLPWFDGASFAREYGVVVVGVNYRLGPLGYLFLPGVSPGNLGLLDQIAALRWVRDNIEAFGGDSASITVAGSSAGATSIFCMLASPAARGLFQRAILQSGPYSMVTSPEEGELIARKLAQCADVAPRDLASLSVEKLLAAQTQLAKASAAFAKPGTLVRPVMDGTLIPKDLLNAAVAGAKGCAIMIGWTRDEQNTFFVGDEEIETASFSQVASAFEFYCGEDWKTAMHRYREQYPNAGSRELLSRLVGDLRYIKPARAFLEQLSAADCAPWVYRFDWSAPGNAFGACHCIELPFVFNNCETYRRGGAAMLSGSSTAQTQSLGSAVQKSWAQFASDGDPGMLGQVRWPSYRHNDRRILCIDNPPTVVSE